MTRFQTGAWSKALTPAGADPVFYATALRLWFGAVADDIDDAHRHGIDHHHIAMHHGVFEEGGRRIVRRRLIRQVDKVDRRGHRRPDRYGYLLGMGFCPLPDDDVVD